MNAALAAEFVLLSAIWGASFLFTRLSVVDFGTLPTAFVRVAVASAVLLPLLLWQGQAGVLRRHWKSVFVVGILNSAIPFTCFAFALLSISTGLSSILNATTPLFGAVVAWLWLKDRPDGWRIAGLVIGFSGIVLLASGKASFTPDASGYSPGWAILACLLATLSYGIAASFTKRRLGGLPSIVTSTGSQIGATLVLAIPALWLWPAQPPSALAWGSVAALGALCSGIAYILFFRLIEQAGPARALAVTFMIPVFALVYGVLLLDEPITPLMIGSGLVILGGTALSTGLIRPSPLRR